MGDTVDMMLDGTLCQVCGGWIDYDIPDHPRTCKACKREAARAERNKGGE